MPVPLTDPIAIFTVVVLVLLAAPLVARRGVPSSVVLLAAGIVLGPHALGVLDRDPTMVLLGTVGLLYIMFLAGLEIDLHELAAGKARSLSFGLATFALPQGVGTAVGRGVFEMGWPSAILLGSVFASHTLLAYPAAARLGLQKERSVTTAVGATILTDTLALLVLAVIATGARAGGVFDLGVLVRVAGSLLAFGGAVLWGLPRVGAWFLRTAASDAALEFVFVLAAVFLCALGVEALGVEPIIGAFLAGLGLNRLVPEGGALMNRVGFVGNALFIPFFLLATGMLVDLAAFAGGPGAVRAWTVALTMSATLLVTKGTAAWLMRPAFRFSLLEVGLLFGLTVPQAAATLAAVLVGVEVGLFDAAVLNGTIAMVFVTCLVGPFVVERAGRRVAADAERRTPDARDARQRVLVSVANPATVGPLMDLAVLVRDGRAGEPVVAVTIVPSGPEQEEAVSRAERVLSSAVVHAAGAEVPVLPLVRVETNVARALARTAAETRTSVVVTGWDGSAVAERLLFGTVPDRVLRETTAAVLVARETRPPGTLRRLVVAVPPLADREAGFEASARLIATLRSRIAADVSLLVCESECAGVAAAWARAVPSGPVPTILALPDWRGLAARLDEMFDPADGLVLLSAREGSVAWQPSLDRLPRQLARHYPAASLFVLYPGQAQTSAIRPDVLSSADRAFLDYFRPGAVVLGLRPGAPADIYRQTLGDAPGAPALATLLADVPDDARPELCPGVVLAHTRTADGEPVIRLGVSREGVGLPGVSGPVHLVVVLAVPESVPSRLYLGWLALIARLVGDAATVEAVRQAATADEARTVLVQALHEPEVG